MDMEKEFVLNWYEKQLSVEGLSEVFQLRLTEETFGNLSGDFEELLAQLLIRSGLAGITREFPRNRLLPFYSLLIYRQDETILFKDARSMDIRVDGAKKIISFPHALPLLYAPIIAARIFLWFMGEDLNKSFEIEFPAIPEPLTRKGKVIVVGAGSLGGVAIKTLLDLGLDSIVVVEPGEVKLNGLYRQLFYDYGDVGYPKATVLERELKRLYPNTRIRIYNEAYSPELLKLERPDLVIGSVDNSQSRRLINDSCRRYSTPCIDGRVEAFEGYVMYSDGTSLFNQIADQEREDGVLPKETLPFVSYFAGMLQASIAARFLNEKKFAEELFKFDLKREVFETLRIAKKDSPANRGSES